MSRKGEGQDHDFRITNYITHSTRACSLIGKNLSSFNFDRLIDIFHR